MFINCVSPEGNVFLLNTDNIDYISKEKNYPRITSTGERTLVDYSKAIFRNGTSINIYSPSYDSLKTLVTRSKTLNE